VEFLQPKAFSVARSEEMDAIIKKCSHMHVPFPVPSHVESSGSVNTLLLLKGVRNDKREINKLMPYRMFA